MAVFLGQLAYALGDEMSSVEEAEAKGRLASPAAALRQAGFERHYVCGPDTTAYDLAYRAIQGLKGHLGEVGAIVYATCIPLNANVGSERRFHETRDVKHLMDFPASRVQVDFGLQGAIVIGLNQQACTGLLGSLRLASALLQAEPQLNRVLCVTADRFPPGALYEQSYNLISDGAAACLVSTEPHEFRLVATHAVTNGALGAASDEEVVGTYFNATHQVITETLQRAGLHIDDIAWIVPQNMNVRAWQILSRLLHFDFCRVYCPTLPLVGHVISADNVINLTRLSASVALSPGQRVLLIMAGYGLNWQCVILERQ